MLLLREIPGHTYKPEGVEIWLGAPNRSLGGMVPWHLIDAGQWERVLAAARALEDQGTT